MCSFQPLIIRPSAPITTGAVSVLSPHILVISISRPFGFLHFERVFRSAGIAISISRHVFHSWSLTMMSGLKWECDHPSESLKLGNSFWGHARRKNERHLHIITSMYLATPLLAWENQGTTSSGTVKGHLSSQAARSARSRYIFKYGIWKHCMGYLDLLFPVNTTFSY